MNEYKWPPEHDRLKLYMINYYSENMATNAFFLNQTASESDDHP